MDLAKPAFEWSTVDGEGDVIDYYRFELSEPQEVGLGLREQERNGDLFIEDADGNVLHRSKKGGTANEWLSATLLEGTYYLRVEAQETGASGYQLRYGVADADEVERLREEAEPPPNTPATRAPAISGTAQVGETLTADTSGIADADGLSNVSYGYQWIRNDGNADTEIAGATASSYTLAAADEGSAIKARVSFTDDAGHSETLTSTATAAVAAPAVETPKAVPKGKQPVETQAHGIVQARGDARLYPTLCGNECARAKTLQDR